MYYTSRTVLFWVCAFNEMFYIALYCYYHRFLSGVATVLLVASSPIWAFKQIVNVIQMVFAAKHLASLDSKH